MTTVHAPLARPPLLDVVAAACGPLFVASALVGNSLTESVAGDGDLATLGLKATSLAVRAGLALELVGLVLLAACVGWLGSLVLRSGGATMAATTMLVTGTAAVTVKLSSGADLLAGLLAHDRIDEATAAALVASNGVAFELLWVVYGVFVASAGVALAASGLVGRAWRAAALVLGVLTTACGVAGAVEPALAVPIPFLLSLVWLVGVAGRLLVGAAGVPTGERMRRAGNP